MRPITTNTAYSSAEAFAELQKAWQAFGDLSMCGQLSRTAYTSDFIVAVGDQPNIRAFLIGVNTNQIRGQNDSLLSGLDLSKVTTYAEANITTPIEGDQLSTTYAFHDCIFVIDANGNLSCKW